MSRLADSVPEYITSDHFTLLDSESKNDAETLLAVWCGDVGHEPSAEAVEGALKKVARLDLPLASRRAFPELLIAFLEWAASVGGAPGAGRWVSYVSRIEDRYAASFRDDDSVKGKTFRKKGEGVGRNEPCPCGSGRKFKKCCMGTLS